jgi:uncharacterized protein YceH (UPF0502 family)
MKNGSVLSPVEARVLACLVEKELATPEYYPLSLNSLVLACNQRSNRDPVLELGAEEVERALSTLMERRLAARSAEGGRVAKYRHFLVEALDLSRPVLAVLCELLLRGPQTAGELKVRASRMAGFSDLEAVLSALGELEGAHPPLAVRMPRAPGRKESRYAQLLTGEPAAGEGEGCDAAEGGAPAAPGTGERLLRLEEEVAALREELAALRKSLGE